MSRSRTSTVGLLAASGVTVVGLTLTGIGVYAGLNATASNATPQTASSGTLSLTMGANGAGFTSSITALAPGDVVNRYVDLTNGGTLAAQALTLGVVDGTPTKLSTDATNGLHVTVTACTGGASPAWTPGTGTCTGTGAATSVLASNVALSTLGTPVSLISGAQAPGLVNHLQLSITLPNQTETTVNGVLPGTTIQGLSASLTWTFTEAQRTATTTNS